MDTLRLWFCMLNRHWASVELPECSRPKGSHPNCGWYNVTFEAIKKKGTNV